MIPRSFSRRPLNVCLRFFSVIQALLEQITSSGFFCRLSMETHIYSLFLRTLFSETLAARFPRLLPAGLR